MLKSFCDLCKLEVGLGDTNVSIYTFVEWRLDKNQGRIPVKKQEDYCGPCTLKVQTAVKELKKEKTA